MFRSTRSRDSLSDTSDATVDMAPLIDMVFILLIFFLVTANFQQDGGIDLIRPDSQSASQLPIESLRVVVDAHGEIYRDGAHVSLESLRSEIERFMATNPDGAVTIAPDTRTEAGRLIAVMDQAKLAGAQDISVVTRQPTGATP